MPEDCSIQRQYTDVTVFIQAMKSELTRAEVSGEEWKKILSSKLPPTLKLLIDEMVDDQDTSHAELRA